MATIYLLASIYQDARNIQEARKPLEFISKIRPWDQNVNEYINRMQ